MNFTEAQTRFAAERGFFEERGAIIEGARSYLPDEFRRNFNLAMDAYPSLTTDPNSAVMAMLTTYVDPSIYEVLFSPLKIAEYLGEKKTGDWVTDTAAFPVVEHTGQTSSYSDWSNNGMSRANANWPQRQSYNFQTFVMYGDRELARASLAKLNWVSELDKAAANNLNVNSNLTYAYGVRGLQNYGIMNDPNLPAAITPAAKAAGGVTWYTSGGTPNATANEVYNDILALFNALVVANAGLVDADTKMTLALGPGPATAFQFTNSFGLNVKALLKENFPSLRIVTIPQFGTQTAANNNGNPAGNLVQLMADSVEGQQSAFCSFTEKLRTFPIVREASGYKQKQMSGTWGTIIRMPVGFQQMLGV